MKPLKLYPPKPDKVYFYGACLIDMFYPEAGLDGVRSFGSASISRPALECSARVLR